MSTYRPITFTPYDPETHASVSKTVFTGIKFATDDVDDFVLRGTPAPSTLVHWGSPDLSFSVSEITQDDGEVVHQIGLAAGELYAMARDGLFINSNDAIGESFYTDHMFVDITPSSLDGVSRLYEMTLDNTDLQQEVIYLYSISGDELFDGQVPSAQELEAFVTDVETQGSYRLSDFAFATPSEAPLATTTVITDMPTNNYEWADEYYDYLWNPLNDDRVSNGSVNLTISASSLLAGETWAVSLPIMTQPDGETNLGVSRIDFWIDNNTDDLFVQISGGQDGVAGTMRVENYYELFPSESEISDFWDLIYHPLSLIDFVTPFGNGTDTINRVPFKDVRKLPSPELWQDDNPYYTANSFRDMPSFDNSSGEAVFAELNQTYTGGAFESNFISEPGNTTYISGPNLESWYFKGDIRYGNAPDAIKVDFSARKVLEDGWGYTDDFTQWDWPHIDGSSFGDEFFNISEASIGGQYGDDWFHSFDAGGSFIGVGRGLDFVDASAITSSSANPLSATIVRLTADEVWDNGYYAFNAGTSHHIGTSHLVGLDGYRQIQDVVFGSAEGYIRIEIENAYDFNNPENKGIALFSDDIFAGRHVEAGQTTEARLKDIAEIHATYIDDIIDLSSSRHADSVGEVKIYGLDGDDILWGGSSNETLDGGNGADLINGGAGNDTLTGGSGADIFEFTATSDNDIVTDFSETDNDRLKFYVGQNDSTSWSFVDKTLIWGDVSVDLSGYEGSQASLANFLTFVDLETRQEIEMGVTVAGTVIYGSPVSGAKVYLDYNDDGLQGNDEPWALTNNVGRFELESDGQQFTIRASADNNAIATTTGQAVEFELEATPDFSVLSVFSSVLANGNLTPDELLELLGLNTELDLVIANPWSNQANNSSDLFDLAKRESQITAILEPLQQLVNATNPNDSDVFSDILNAIGDAFAENSVVGSTVDLSNGDFINGVLAELPSKYVIDSGIAASVIQAIANVNAAIASSSDASDLAVINSLDIGSQVTASNVTIEYELI